MYISLYMHLYSSVPSCTCCQTRNPTTRQTLATGYQCRTAAAVEMLEPGNFCKMKASRSGWGPRSRALPMAWGLGPQGLGQGPGRGPGGQGLGPGREGGGWW